MVGILIVSHSAKLAEGVRELVQQMAPDVPIVAAGGTEDGEIGTSFDLISEGLTRAERGDGVLVLMDLGSAVMTAELALDFLDEATRARVRLSNAPLVEGAVAAATMAAGGAELAAVAAAADEARGMQKIAGGETEIPEAIPSPAEQEGEERELEIVNPAGLHARPASQLVQALSEYQADVSLRNLSRSGKSVSARSLVAVLGLGAQQGHTVAVSASGPDSRAVLDKVEALIRSGFGEMDEQPPPLPAPRARQEPPPSTTEGSLRCIPVAPGIGIGPAFPLRHEELEIPQHTIDDPIAEVARLDEALLSARQELSVLEQQSAMSVGEVEAGIFAAQRLLLDDPMLLDGARQRIEQTHENAAAAWHVVTQAQAQALRAVDDPLIAARAADLLDVGRRVLRQLVEADDLPEVPTGVVVVAEEMTPSQTTALRDAGVVGIATVGGGSTSHAAILARALGIPAVAGLGSTLQTIPRQTPIILDGTEGVLVVEPDEELLHQYQTEAEAGRVEQEAAREAAQAPAQTADGRRVEVGANVASVEEAEAAVANGAEGVGLLRTEFLYLERRELPSEAEQVAALRAIFAPLGDRPIIVRTLDVGGDK
ncbi:MAG: dihydroxyacetone kinase phosphoryl donor subunit DhaM, partial [Chloroflexota bacterium]|nr:dihydroxyacetone kinase phosphoryl donor subunit DhaM [Chloroflexota bacterium]